MNSLNLDHLVLLGEKDDLFDSSGNCSDLKHLGNILHMKCTMHKRYLARIKETLNILVLTCNCRDIMATYDLEMTFEELCKC